MSLDSIVIDHMCTANILLPAFEHYSCNWCAFVAPAGLLSSFVEVESIKRHFKSRLVGTVLNGYLCLRKLVVQRTKLIDETQDMLLEMLEDMTTGPH